MGGSAQISQTPVGWCRAGPIRGGWNRRFCKREQGKSARPIRQRLPPHRDAAHGLIEGRAAQSETVGIGVSLSGNGQVRAANSAAPPHRDAGARVWWPGAVGRRCRCDDARVVPDCARGGDSNLCGMAALDHPTRRRVDRRVQRQSPLRTKAAQWKGNRVAVCSSGCLPTSAIPRRSRARSSAI